MAGETNLPAIKAINRAAIHKICSGQVILDLQSAVKELVENSLDAGATSIEICLKEYGEESFKVIDNGSGISPANFQALARKHHTSKITDFSDLHTLTTFGFRGEALSSLCALGNVTVETRTKDEPVGTHLTYDHSGSVTAERKTARQVGTTVTVEKLFSSFPVRSKEFSRNIRREYGKLISLLNCSLSIKGIKDPKKEVDSSELDIYMEDEEPHSAAKTITSVGDGHMETNCSHELVVGGDSLKTPQVRTLDSCEEKKSAHADENEISKSMDLTAWKDYRYERLSGYQFKQPVSLPKPTVVNDRRSAPLAKSAKKDNSSHSNLIQSSLTNFVNISKRKHEDSCKLLSEVPVLRNEMPACQVRKMGSEIHSSISRSEACKVPRADFPGTNVEKVHEPSKVCSRGKSPLASEIKTAENSEELDPSSPSDAIPEVLSVKDQETISGKLSTSSPSLDSCDVVTDVSKPCSGFVTCHINELRKRRSKRLSILLSNKTTYSRHHTQRHYTAARLDSSQPDNDEAKSESLAAATIELERFFKKEDFGRMQVVGQFNLGFIIGKLDEELFIVDQHAADEKHTFEKLAESTVLHLQPLLRPIRLELSPEEEVVTSMHMETIRKNGFALMEDKDAPPGHHFLLKALPFSKNITFGVEDLKDLISTLADSQGECSVMSSYKTNASDSICPSRVRGMLASRACRTSVMIGDSLTQREMQNILRNLADLKSPWNCPHGRPTMRHLVDLADLQGRSEYANQINSYISKSALL